MSNDSIPYPAAIYLLKAAVQALPDRLRPLFEALVPRFIGGLPASFIPTSEQELIAKQYCRIVELNTANGLLSDRNTKLELHIQDMAQQVANKTASVDSLTQYAEDMKSSNQWLYRKIDKLEARIKKLKARRVK